MSNHRSSVFALAAVSSLVVTALAPTGASAMHAGFGGGSARNLGGNGVSHSLSVGSSGNLGQGSGAHIGSNRRGLIAVSVRTPGNQIKRTPVSVQVGTPLVPLGPPNVQLGPPNVQLGTPVVPLGPPNVQIGKPLIPVIPPGKPPCEGFCGPILPPPVVAGPDPHGHPGFEWHHPHWGIVVDQTPVAVDPVSVDTVAATAPCNCLTKQYLDDGSVLFKDLCTKEAAMATPDELRAQAQGAVPQAQ